MTYYYLISTSEESQCIYIGDKYPDSKTVFDCGVHLHWPREGLTFVGDQQIVCTSGWQGILSIYTDDSVSEKK